MAQESNNGQISWLLAFGIATPIISSSSPIPNCLLINIKCAGRTFWSNDTARDQHTELLLVSPKTGERNELQIHTENRSCCFTIGTFLLLLPYYYSPQVKATESIAKLIVSTREGENSKFLQHFRLSKLERM